MFVSQSDHLLTSENPVIENPQAGDLACRKTLAFVTRFVTNISMNVIMQKPLSKISKLPHKFDRKPREIVKVVY